MLQLQSSHLIVSYQFFFAFIFIYTPRPSPPKDSADLSRINMMHYFLIMGAELETTTDLCKSW